MKNKFGLYFCYMFIILLCIIWILSGPLYGQNPYVKNALESRGARSKGTIGERNVIYATNKTTISEIEFYVPKEGKYHLLAHIYHNWRNVLPFIYVKAVDSKGQIHKGQMGFENIWYLDENSPNGRWFIKTFNDSFWELPRGKLTVYFWIDSTSSIWDVANIHPIENIIAIDTFFLSPIFYNKSRDLFSTNFIQPESGWGGWFSTNYSKRYFCNLICNKDTDEPYYLNICLPSQGKYLVTLSMISYGQSSIKLVFRKRNFSQDIIFYNEFNDKMWHSISSDPLFFEDGSYTVEFQVTKENQDYHYLCIDYILFIKLPG